MSSAVRLGAVWVVLAGVLGCAATSANGNAVAGVDEATLRAEIDRYACADVLDDYDGVQVLFGDVHCASSQPSSSAEQVQAAVGRAIADSQLLMALDEVGLFQAYETVESPVGRSDAELDAAVRAAYWADRHLGPAVLRRSIERLEGAGIECRDCPAVEPPVTRTFSWAQLRPYLIAWIWPSDDPESPSVQIYVCGGSNGVAALGLGEDTVAVEVGHLAALGLAMDERLASQIAAISERVEELPQARAEIAAMLDSPEARRVICDGVEQFAWFTGAVLTDCPA